MADNVDHPSHYTAFPLEVIDMMQILLDAMQERGIELTGFQAHCFCTLFKYRMRAGLKDPSKIVEDIEKAKWYQEKLIGVKL